MRSIFLFAGLASANVIHQRQLETKIFVQVETALVTVTVGGEEQPTETPTYIPPASTSTSTSTTPPAISSPVVQVAAAAMDTSASIAPSSASSSFSNAILNSTNFFRNQYEAAPLTWNDTLASFAQSWASRCYFAHSGHGFGENIAAAWPTLTATDGVDMWGDEESSYDWVTATFSESTGHFTQLVWQGTTTVGCALVSCNNQDTSNGGINGGDFLVCEYMPAGNVMGYFKENVRKVGMSTRGVPGLGERSSSAAVRKGTLGWAVIAGVLMVGAALV